MIKKPAPATSKIVQKENLHIRNLHRGRYDFRQLCKSNPQLEAFVSLNHYGDESIDFSNPKAVKALNQAILKYFYRVDYWDIPQGYLCPPVPGRADYIHYAADILTETNDGTVPLGSKIKVLDIGVGANCVYPLIGNSVYKWQFVGADVDTGAIQSAKKIISLNKNFQDKIECRLQTNRSDIFKGIIKPNEYFDLTICNPPFHSSAQEAHAATTTKWKKLGLEQQKATLNFGGKNNKLWYEGGEAAFISLMIEQSASVKKQCLWFSTLVSKKETLPVIYNILKSVSALSIKTINMSQGQKTSRIVAWTFLNEPEINAWKMRWVK